ncbi:endonuclease domain-containing protein [Sulfuritortus calidifontis]|uniref:endonuclease domain-containing protein n=1 Tax=Sulfuritortus calidifontis TaxID=1914471 RepID=UPI001E46F463|nr:endonuclease domain-containing protein [Sulfuritortus calidifontis]
MRNRQLEGCKFRRQHAIGPYIADFVCLEAALILELDGGQHAAATSEDARRTAYLQRQGFRVLRFWNNEVLGNLAGVLEVIRQALLKARPSPQRSDQAPAFPYPQEGGAATVGASAPLTPALSPEGRGGKAKADLSPLPSGERVRVRGDNPHRLFSPLPSEPV